MSPRRPSPCTLAFVLLAGAATASAASPSAWEEFRRDVEQSCRAASVSHLTEPQIAVDPFGSQSYGLAFLSGTPVEPGGPQSLVCVYDKVAGTVEIGGTLALESAVPALRPDLAEGPSGLPAPGAASERLLSPSALSDPPALAALQPFGANEGGAPAASPIACDAQCATTLERLTEGDRAELEELPAQIERTLAANADASLGSTVAAVRTSAQTAAGVARGQESDLVPPGEGFVGSASCTLYYFGLQGEAARTVGTHQCRVSTGEDGGLVVEKTSGERLRAEIRPLVGDLSAFVGRSFQPGASNQAYDVDQPEDSASGELGNTVGFAAADEDRLMLISSQRRRFEASDSFFWVLAMNRP